MIFQRAPEAGLIEARVNPPWGAVSLRDASLSWSWDEFQVPEHPRPAVKRYDIDTLSCILLKASCGLAEWNLYLKYTNYCQGRDGTKSTVKGPNALLNPPGAAERETWSHCLCSNNRKGDEHHHHQHPSALARVSRCILSFIINYVCFRGRANILSRRAREEIISAATWH